MGLFGSLFGNKEDERLAVESEKARINYETAASVLVLDELIRDLNTMHEFYRQSDRNSVIGMARRAAENELFNPDGVRPGLTHAVKVICAKAVELNGGDASDVVEILSNLGLSGKAGQLAQCCREEQDWMNKNMRR